MYPTASVTVLSHICLHLYPTTGLVFNNSGSKSAVWVQRQLLRLLRLVVRLDFRAAELRDVLQNGDVPNPKKIDMHFINTRIINPRLFKQKCDKKKHCSSI